MLTSLLTQTLKLTIRGSNLRWMEQTTGMTYVVGLLEDMLSAILVMSYWIQTSRTWACPIFVTT